MPIHRLNHAVLFVGDLERSLRFYRGVLGFRVVMSIEGKAAFLQAAGSDNDHDLGLFQVGAGQGLPWPAARRSACITSPGRLTRLLN